MLATRRLVPAAALAGAVALWAWSLPHIDPNRMSDLGLISVLPASFLTGLALLVIAFALTLANCFESGRFCRALLCMEIVLLTLMLYGTPALVEVVPRSGTMWLHLGIADYIATHGSVDRTIDAYFNWPGFFIALAFIQRVTGVTSLAGLGAWAPPFFNLLDAVVLFGLFRFGFREERAAWLAVWVFLCTNWIGQDILSPQAFAYFLYLTILLLAVATAAAARRRLLSREMLERVRSRLPELRRLRALAASLPPPTPPQAMDESPASRWPASGQQRLSFTLIVTALFGAVAISHQLTPYTIAIVLAGLVVLNVSSLRAMPILMTLIIFVWFTYSAVPFLQQFLHHEASSLGEVRQNFSASVTARVGGTRAHESIVYVRLVLTATLWTFAALMALVRFWRGRRDTAFLVLGAAPFVLAGLQSYGGEIALRIYLFTLPAAAFFVAASLTNAFRSGNATRIALPIIAMSFVLLPFFLVCRYGNERLDYFRESEYRTVRVLYRVAPPGSKFYVLASDLPWRWQRYASDETFVLYPYVRIYATRLASTVDTIANTMAEDKRPTFLVFTPAQTTFATYIGGVAPATVVRFEQLIARSRRFVPVYANGESVIYRLASRRVT
jgi:hypothetical protein